MSLLAHLLTRPTVAALAGAMTMPVSVARQAFADEPAVQSAPREDSDRETPTESCFAESICALKSRVRWRTAAWGPSYCHLIARGILTAAKTYDLPPSLLLAVMLNESDLNEKAVATTMRNGQVYAKDSGLMGIRCVVDKQGRCTNGFVHGLSWKHVMDPVTNIDLGARELARWREGGGVTEIAVRVRDASGGLQTRKKLVACQHRTHAYWAHYNHGPRYIDRGQARHYPHRIAVLYYALAKAMNLEAPQLTTSRITIHDPGLRERTPDRPVEARYRKLCDQIRGVGSACSGVATLTN